MASRRELQISNTGCETEDTDQTFRETVQSGPNVVESFPSLIVTQNTGPITDPLRSVSANDACLNDLPLAVSIHRETKAAFEDSPPLHAVKTGDNKESDDESSRLLATRSVTDLVTKVTQDTTEMMSSTNEKKGATSKDIKIIITSSVDDRSLLDSQEEAVSSGQYALFQRRTPRKEISHQVFRDKRDSAISPEGASNTYGNIKSWQGTQGFKDTELRNQLLLVNSKSNSMDGDGIGTSHDQRNNVTRKQAKVSCDEHTDRQTLNRAYQKEEDANKTDAPKRPDTIGPLSTFPTQGRGRFSMPSLSQISSPRETGGSSFRRVSAGGASNFPTASTSGQGETSLSPGSSDVSGVGKVRRGSRSRRSSTVASTLGSSNATQSRRDSVQGDGKKVSIAFSTLASSLVKWKMNLLKAARKNKQTIAKNAKHQEFMDRTADRIKTELPRSLLVSIQEEVYPIILKTAQAYRSQLGAKHKLTVQATDRLKDLIRDLKDPY